MNLKGKRIGFAFTASYCTLNKVFTYYEKLAIQGAELYPIISEAVRDKDSRFGKASMWRKKIEEISSHQIIDTINKAEPIGPQKLLDLLIIAPCTGNTMAKIARGIIDKTVVMAAKAHLRNESPLLISIATNDGLGLNAQNLSILLNTSNIFFVPFGQDEPREKPNSLVAREELLLTAAELALEKKQLQPVIIEYNGI